MAHWGAVSPKERKKKKESQTNGYIIVPSNLNTLYLHAKSLEGKIAFGIRINVVKVILKRVVRNYKKFRIKKLLFYAKRFCCVF